MITLGYGVGPVVTRGLGGWTSLPVPETGPIMRVSGTGQYLVEEPSGPLTHEQLLTDDEEVLLVII